MKKIKNPNMVADAMYYASVEWTADDEHSRGVVVGLVSGIMACGYSFDQAVDACVEGIKGRPVRKVCIPDSWRPAFLQRKVNMVS